MLSLIISQFRLFKNLLNNTDESEAAITAKEKFALFWLIIGGLIMGIFFLIFIYIFATTYEFREFSLDMGGPMG
jgi:uncharacterized integral membrane protein